MVGMYLLVNNGKRIFRGRCWKILQDKQIIVLVGRIDGIDSEKEYPIIIAVDDETVTCPLYVGVQDIETLAKECCSVFIHYKDGKKSEPVMLFGVSGDGKELTYYTNRHKSYSVAVDKIEKFEVVE